MPIFRKYCYSNTIKIMLFISDIESYVLSNYVKHQVVYIYLS